MLTTRTYPENAGDARVATSHRTKVDAQDGLGEFPTPEPGFPRSSAPGHSVDRGNGRPREPSLLLNTLLAVIVGGADGSRTFRGEEEGCRTSSPRTRCPSTTPTGARGPDLLDPRLAGEPQVLPARHPRALPHWRGSWRAMTWRGRASRGGCRRGSGSAWRRWLLVRYTSSWTSASGCFRCRAASRQR